MGVITEPKEWNDVHQALIERGDLPVVVLGCSESARGCTTGGKTAVRAVKTRVRGAGVMYHEPKGMPEVLAQGLCDPTAVARLLEPLRKEDPCQLLVLACGAGLWCVHETVPGTCVVPGLDTLGVGVGAQLTCIACGDCGFGRDGCKMTNPLRRRADRLATAYGKGKER